MEHFDAIIIGAGAAGLFCAGIAGQRGLRVLLLDHAERVAEKIRISGGGRCNFTNRDASPAQFLSDNPSFCRSALARYRPSDFIELLDRHGIGYHEKHLGQLFCDRSSADVINMLLAECAAGQVVRRQPCAVRAVRQPGGGGFELDTDAGVVRGAQLVVATGGLPVPQIGASDFGLKLARQFGHAVVEPRPALVPLTLAAEPAWAQLAGVALPVRISTGSGKQRRQFEEDLLITHRGLSGPAALQISSYWRAGQAISLNLWPRCGADGQLAEVLRQAKNGSRRQLGTVLTQLDGHPPQRLLEHWISRSGLDLQQPIADTRDRDLERLARQMQEWSVIPDGTEGWKKAEVMAGGVDTRRLSSQSLASLDVPGLHFIGEVVDVTGWLGGYNFQWAWASAAACARSLQTTGGATLN
jgi:predicted Rossmann fold flavoprotein